MLSSSCLVIWHAVDPSPITRAGEATLGVVLAKDILERTPVLAAFVITIKSPDEPSEAEKKSKTSCYDNPVAKLTTEMPKIL